jgi:Holliday junction resolvase RusA-like endonuclease
MMSNTPGDFAKVTPRMADPLAGIRLVLPLPPPELSPNARVHHMAKARKIKAYRALALAAGIKAVLAARKTPNWHKATVQPTFYHARRRDRDGDNLTASLKAAFDGAADAGIIANDKGLTQLAAIQRIDRNRPRVELLFRPVKGGHD